MLPLEISERPLTRLASTTCLRVVWSHPYGRTHRRRAVLLPAHSTWSGRRSTLANDAWRQASRCILTPGPSLLGNRARDQADHRRRSRACRASGLCAEAGATVPTSLEPSRLAETGRLSFSSLRLCAFAPLRENPLRSAPCAGCGPVSINLEEPMSQGKSCGDNSSTQSRKAAKAQTSVGREQGHQHVPFPNLSPIFLTKRRRGRDPPQQGLQGKVNGRCGR
jgi:hypothetical protein